MFRFESPLYLYALLLIPVFVLCHIAMLHVRKRRLQRFGDKELVLRLMPRYSRARREFKFWLSMLCLLITCFLLARPQNGSKAETVQRRGIEAIICLDVSRSMLAVDNSSSELCRLDWAKMMISTMVDNMANDRIGLVVFAGDAFTQLPLTSDFVSAKMFISSVSPDLIYTQGTDIANALTIASRGFSNDPEVGKAIFVITDGENHEGGAEEAAKAAAEQGINIYVLGIGGKGAPIPQTPGKNDYIVDETGQTVISRLNADMCRSIAQAGRGQYIYVDNVTNAQKTLANQLDNLAKKEFESFSYSERDEQFPIIAIILFITLFAELVIYEAKSLRLR